VPSAGAAAANPAAGSGEESESKREVALVVRGFMQALQQQDWTKAAGFFCADFRQGHEKELLDGSLLAYDPHAGVTIQAILNSPNAKAGGVEIRGSYAWAGVQSESGGESWPQIWRLPAYRLRTGIWLATLELVREGDQWKLLRFPPSEAAMNAIGAGSSGKIAGAWFKSMLSDGDFSQREQAEMADVLGAYYAMVVETEFQGKEHTSLLREFLDATMDELLEVAEKVKARPDLRLVSVTFWRQPVADAPLVSETLAEDALSRIFHDLAAAKDRFPELAQFDAEHARIWGGSLFYAPVAPAYHEKVSKPTIGVFITAPYLGVTQMASPQRIFLPAQGLAVARVLLVDDPELAEFVKRTIEENLAALESFERVLGSEPVADNW
jgi:hypothetical protein